MESRESLPVSKTEPALTVGGIVAALAALLALLVQFGVNLTEGQTTAILTFVSVAGPLVAVAVVRGKVRPVAASRSCAPATTSRDI